MRLALFQPDIPQNAGAMLRLGACFRVPVDIIEPCGFPLDDKKLKRAAMDYGGTCDIARHASWEQYLQDLRALPGARLILLSTLGSVPYTDFSFQPGDSLMLGRESAGVPEDVHRAADALVRIPIAAETRSLNVVTAAAIVLTEALRQTGFLEGKTML
ncbi:MAG: tRNA (cytidine(34)-2'-O)-methyltransferase [Gammaproteobacteria bacterium]|nr:tRNA (cytidine(34)-2'-O)-methyltransferase [Gammaproteobacteria bacterium]